MNVHNLKMHFNNNANQNNQPDSKISPNVLRTHIPIARFGMRNSGENVNSVNTNTPLSPSDKWKSKFEEVEKKRKTLLTQNQKLTREHEDLNRRHLMLQKDMDASKKELMEKDAKLEQLRKLSEGVYKEYDQLKNQYELETGTMEQVMQRASQWYKQNRELKRRSTVLLQRMIQVAPESFTDLSDETDNSSCTDDLDELRQAVQELNHQVSCLQAELNSTVQQEFEAQESIIELTSALENEKNARIRAESELQELRSMKENLGQVKRMFATEVYSLREQYEREKEVAQRMKSDADKAKKERNVLAHQSQLLMCEVASDERLMQLLNEIENLKRNLEEEQQTFATQIQQLQDKLEERENEAQLEFLEEKLKLTESELLCSLQRAERAETYSNQLNSKLTKLENELESCRQHSIPSTLLPPPPPPPLPPPPPPLPELVYPVPQTRNGLRRNSNCEGAESNFVSTGSAVLQMANLLGIPRKTAKPPVQTVAIDDIINEIKGGRFTLKATEKQKVNRVEEQPPVVQEMINVLGTLRRRRNPSFRTKQNDTPPADVAL